jgi:hypothetical protein
MRIWAHLARQTSPLTDEAEALRVSHHDDWTVPQGGSEMAPASEAGQT